MIIKKLGIISEERGPDGQGPLEVAHSSHGVQHDLLELDIETHDSREKLSISTAGL